MSIAPAYRTFQAADEADWLQWRRGGIGSSDAPAVLGCCPHRTRLQVYNSKVYGERHHAKAAHGWGNRLEDDIAEAYSERTGLAIVETQHLVESETFPWMRASVDCVREDGRGVELKALSVYQANNWHARDGEWEALPHNFLVQCHHQMIVMDADAWDLAVFYPLELRVYTIPRSEDLCGLVVDLTGELWECVCDRTPPRTLDPRDHERIEDAYPRAEGEIFLDDPSLVDDARLWRASKDKGAKVRILDAMGEAATAILADGSTLRRSKREVKGYVVPDKTQTILKWESPSDAVPE